MARSAICSALLLVGCAFSQSRTSEPIQKEVFTAEEQKRAAKLEDTVASQFDMFRKDGGLRRLSRASTAQKYRQILCSYAVRSPGPAEWSEFSARYQFVTQDAKLEDSKLRQVAIAATKRSDSGFFRFQRYVVTVYPARLANFPAGTYWVELDFLGSEIANWVDNNFTDDIYYKNKWKAEIAPQCEGVR